jgi:hypothetical protein
MSPSAPLACLRAVPVRSCLVAVHERDAGPPGTSESCRFANFFCIFSDAQQRRQHVACPERNAVIDAAGAAGTTGIIRSRTMHPANVNTGSS